MIENKKSLDNKGGYISPEAMIQDISKSLKTLTPKNILGVSKEIADKLGVSVKKVQKILQEYVSKYGDKLKDKIADLADDIADKTGARAKFMGDEGTGISGKIDDDILNLLKNEYGAKTQEQIDYYYKMFGEDMLRKELNNVKFDYTKVKDGDIIPTPNSTDEWRNLVGKTIQIESSDNITGKGIPKGDYKVIKVETGVGGVGIMPVKNRKKGYSTAAISLKEIKVVGDTK